MSPSKIQKARDIALSREREKQLLLQNRELRDQKRAQKKVQKEVEAHRKRDERPAAAAVGKTTADQKKAATQRAREARKARKGAGVESRAANRQLQSRPERQVAAQSTPNTLQEPAVIEPVERVTTAKGRPVHRPARFRK